MRSKVTGGIWPFIREYQPDRVKLRDGQAAHPRNIREALALECHRRIDADKTVATLEGLVAERGTAPAFIRCDNGPELTANASKGLVPVLARGQRIHREEPDDRAAHGRRVAARRAARPRGHPDLARRRPRRAQVSRMTRTITAMTRAMMAIVRVFMRRLPVVEQDASKGAHR